MLSHSLCPRDSIVILPNINTQYALLNSGNAAKQKPSNAIKEETGGDSFEESIDRSAAAAKCLLNQESLDGYSMGTVCLTL